MLVPTTILAQQHSSTFDERLRDQPVEIEHALRFRTAAENNATRQRFADGQVDIVIGTHRLLREDVRARLGLLIVDEEHRFGVKHKERISELKRERSTCSR